MQIRHWLIAIMAVITVMWGCSKKTEPTARDPETQPQTVAPEDGNTEGNPGVWMTDFEAAKAKAVEEGKDLLVDFSGSDWCYWCKRLDGEVFSKPGFVDKVSEDSVLVKIDFPNDKSRQSKQLQAQNDRLSRIYGIQGFPTVILMRPDGTAYAQTGYQEGGADTYVQHLKELRRQR